MIHTGVCDNIYFTRAQRCRNYFHTASHGKSISQKYSSTYRVCKVLVQRNMTYNCVFFRGFLYDVKA